MHELNALALRLARALGEAHRAGTLHLALSPERIALPAGTITGFGAAPDMAFAAPEQLWHSGPVGPWTDVYSLGMVLLALAGKSAAPQSTTIVGALAARRQPRDLSVLPEEMRAAVARMIETDRAKRPQSMDEAIALLEGRAIAAAPRRPQWWIAAGAALLCAAAAVAAWSFSFRSEAPAVRAFRPMLPQEERVRRTIEASLKSVSCSWLDISYPQASDGRIRVDAVGAAALPPDEIARRLQAAAGAQVAVNAGAVIAIDRASCAMLDALRAFREPSSEHGRALDVKQAQFHLQTGLQSCKAPDARQAQIVVDARIGDGDFAVFLVDARGGLAPLYADRAAFESAANAIDGGRWRLSFCTASSGPAGVLLIKGHGPFDGAADPASFSDKAWTKGWTTQMAWYRVD